MFCQGSVLRGRCVRPLGADEAEAVPSTGATFSAAATAAGDAAGVAGTGAAPAGAGAADSGFTSGTPGGGAGGR